MIVEQKRTKYIRDLKMLAYRMGTYLRMLSAAKRALPDFLIIGAQKSGTTSLYAHLAQHPNIIPAYRKKEVHYWDNPRNYKKGLLWYRAHFPLLKELQAASAITGEKTPNYLENPEYIKKIKGDCPNAKIIILLRNPVERTISNYFMKVRRGFEKLPLMEALLSEEERLASPSERRKYGMERAYKIRGIYAPSIKACLDNFSPDQMVILDSHEFFKSPALILKGVYNLLDISQINMPEINFHKNLGGYDKSDIPQEVYIYLQNFYRPYNEELYALLGRDFGWEG